MAGKLSLTIGVMVLAVLAVAGVGAFGLQRMAGRTNVLYNHSLAVSQHTAAVVAGADDIEATTLDQVIALHDRGANAQLSAELEEVLIPRTLQAITVLRANYSDEPAHRLIVDHMNAGIQHYMQLRLTGAYGYVPDHPGSAAAASALAARTDQILDPIIQSAEYLNSNELVETAAVKKESDAAYLSTRLRLAGSVGVVLLVGLGILIALIRNTVPRIKKYSRFATDIAAGRTATALQPRGHDELSELGIALNAIVVQRELAVQAETAERKLLDEDELAQAEFVDTLHVTSSEEEAQEVLQHHLQRTLPESAVAVLRRNNSANRLHAVTPLADDNELAAKLVGAEPRSCLAVRLGRTHREGTGRPPLLSCALCEHGTRVSTCEPLLVGGEVIGSVLVTRPCAITGSDDTQIKNIVGQAAPVLANLRSLALAEFRANNDSLTGLPNKRATEDTLKRMVAQASRSLTPLSAIMLDLDHFKEINDRYGHSQGDQALAAVGTAISSSLRASDFAGRFGGEEFLILLPETTVDAAWKVAENMRTAIAAVVVPGLDRDITASLGLAGLLEHAGDATGLLREADRAQYAAKAAGRNCTSIATHSPANSDAGTESELVQAT